MTALGAPIALQDLLVSVSFLIILAIVNSMGVIASAGVAVSFVIGVGMFFLTFFHGDVLVGIFSSEENVILATPASSILQLLMCLGFMGVLRYKKKI